LIERCKDGNKLSLSVGLEVSFETHMKVFRDGLLNGIPETNFLYQRVAQSVVGKGKTNTAAGDLV
jgi:hypothetical protein